MSDKKNMEPLVFENSFDFRAKLKEVFEKGGLAELKEFVNKEFMPDRPLKIGDETSYIADVQLRHLVDGKPGKIIMDYKNNSNTTNSMLMMTSNLVNIDTNFQLLIRKKI